MEHRYNMVGSHESDWTAKTEMPSNTRFFLVNHGRYYAKEILFGCVFVPKNDLADAERIREIQAGDVIFHASEKGISAVGSAIRPCRVLPYPAWRYAEGVPGARGYWLDTRDLLLAHLIAPPFSAEGYLTPVSSAQAKALFVELSAQRLYPTDLFASEKRNFEANSVEFS